MEFFDQKSFLEAQIAMKKEEFDYFKSPENYFETMPHLGLYDSQVALTNKYIEILRNKNTSSEFYNMLNKLREENAEYKAKLEAGSKSTKIKKHYRITDYLIRQMEKYDRLY